MKIVGNPDVNNASLIYRIKTNLEFSPNPLQIDENFFDQILRSDMNVLDVGKSLRERENLVKSRVEMIYTLDINVFRDYPDIQMDLCEKLDYIKLFTFLFLKFYLKIYLIINLSIKCYDIRLWWFLG